MSCCSMLSHSERYSAMAVLLSLGAIQPAFAAAVFASLLISTIAAFVVLDRQTLSVSQREARTCALLGAPFLSSLGVGSAPGSRSAAIFRKVPSGIRCPNTLKFLT